jgi:hypothetical protein
VKVYIVMEHEVENSDVIGVYGSANAAKAAHPVKWAPIGTNDPEGWYEVSRRHTSLTIHSWEVVTDAR